MHSTSQREEFYVVPYDWKCKNIKKRKEIYLQILRCDAKGMLCISIMSDEIDIKFFIEISCPFAIKVAIKSKFPKLEW